MKSHNPSLQPTLRAARQKRDLRVFEEFENKHRSCTLLPSVAERCPLGL